MLLVFNQSTVTEHWDPLNNPSGNEMSSRNHPAFGSVGSWLYAALLGVRLGDEATSGFSAPGLPPGAPQARAPQDGYGFARAVVAPEIVTDSRLPGASGGVATPLGLVAASWAFDAGAASLALNASFPVSCRGEVRTPSAAALPPATLSITDAASGAAIWKDGAFVAGAVPGVFGGAACGSAGERVCLDVGSGDYAFLIAA